MPNKIAISDTELRAAERELCRRSLHEFVKLAWPVVEPSIPFIDGWHVAAICEHLQAVSEGHIGNLLVNIPPGHSKSLLVSVFWPAWAWGPAGQPAERIFCASYDQRLSTRDAVRTRALIESEWYRSLWGDRFNFKSDENQKTYVANDKSGWRMASTVRSHATGEHPTVIIIDDPHNVERAESDTEREAVRDWWDLTMSTRGAGIGVRRVCIMQRLHQLDLAGHILESEPEHWTHICLPLRYEADRMATTPLGFNDPRPSLSGDAAELISPEYLGREVAEKLERSLGVYGVAGQLQQRPAPREGGLFMVDRLQMISEERLSPEYDHVCRYWDRAASHGSGDYTVGVLMGRRGSRFFLLDIIRGQWSPGASEARILQSAERDHDRFGSKLRIGFEEEPGSSGKIVSDLLRKKLRSYSTRFERVTGSKEDRANPLAIAVENYEVFVVKAPWARAFIDEMALFPMGKHDDQVDAASGAYRLLSSPRRTAIYAMSDPADEQDREPPYVPGQRSMSPFELQRARARLGWTGPPRVTVDIPINR